MKLKNKSRAPRMRFSECGQSMVLIPLVLLFLLAFAALTVDMGNLYFCYTKLVSATQAAADAGGQAIPTPSDPNLIAKQYSGSSAVSALYNIPTNNNMVLGTPTIRFACVSGSVQTSLNLPPCIINPNVATPSTGENAIQVTETATVTTFFARLFGVNTLNIAATATAGASGSGAIPYNIMVVLDTTASMGSGSDTGCLSSKPSTGYTPEQCAQYGIQTLMTELAPCAQSLSSCGSNPAVDQIGLMVFPGLCSDSATGVTTGNCPAATTLTDTTLNPTYAPPDYACPPTSPPIAAYNNDPEYLVIPFSHDYRTSDTSGLNSSSNLVSATAAGTTSGGKPCGVQTPGGEGTFYAGAIQAAQDYLTEYHRPHVQDVMIVLSDGDATSSAAQMGGSVTHYSTTAECQQAVTVANAAKSTAQSDGTKTVIYSISYGSETTGCTTGDTLTPCGTMSGIASIPLTKYFFSVPQTTGTKTGTVCSGAVPITKLDQVFTTIAGDLETARIIPNSAF